MKDFRILFMAILCAVFLTVSSNCQAADGAMRLGILPFAKDADVSANLTLEDTKIANGIIYEGFANCDDFELLERESVDKLIHEHELNSQGLIDSSTAPAFGKMLGSEYILINSITGLSSRKKTNSIVGAGSRSYIVTARMSARIVEVETGRIVLAATSSATSTNKFHKAGFIVRIGTDEVDQGLVDEAIEKAAENLVDKLMANLEKKKQMSRNG